jgi:phosphatidylglycerol lysyltransferase
LTSADATAIFKDMTARLPAESPSAPVPARPELRQHWPVLLVGFATLGNGLLGLLLGLYVRSSGNPRMYDLPLPFGLYHWSRLLTLIFGFLLLYLSFHLFQRRRNAWWVTCAGLALAAVAHVGHGRHLYLAAAPLVALALLVAYRRWFTVRSESRNILQGLGFMAASLLVALAYGTLGFWLLDRKDFGIEFQWGDALVRALREYALLGNPDLVPHTHQAYWFLDSLSVMGVTAVLFAIYSLFRPIAYRLSTLPHERALLSFA